MKENKRKSGKSYISVESYAIVLFQKIILYCVKYIKISH